MYGVRRTECEEDTRTPLGCDVTGDHSRTALHCAAAPCFPTVCTVPYNCCLLSSSRLLSVSCSLRFSASAHSACLVVEKI